MAYEPIDRRTVYRRDGYRCGICGEQTDPDAPLNSPRAPTLDHIIPVSQGGPHLYANVQCACFECNWRKGDGTDMAPRHAVAGDYPLDTGVGGHYVMFCRQSTDTGRPPDKAAYEIGRVDARPAEATEIERGPTMKGRPPKKNPARRNRSSTKATLDGATKVRAPKLPTRQWHPEARRWWKDIWASPMAPEYLDADQHALVRLAVLISDYWEAESPTARKELAGEIRLQQQAFGLTPFDRHRLAWTIEETNAKKAKGKKRRQKEPAGDASDPRAALDSKS
ncbi:MAG TPA: HNH endonuclease [Solirubrobacterales bacterium]